MPTDARYRIRPATAADLGAIAEIERARLDLENVQLSERLETRRVIDKAKAVLQRDLGLDEQGAYLALQRESRDRRRSMREIADAILLAEEMRGTAFGTWTDLFNIPMTAHFIGGCVIGDCPENGVIDPYHRMYGHPGLHVVDGSAISANLGVNPALTITAQAERAMALWPNRGDSDLRPALGAPYRRIAPVAPRSPAVPPSAPAALRLPIAEIRQAR